MSLNIDKLLADEARYSSFGDTVHYVNLPKVFTSCELWLSPHTSGKDAKNLSQLASQYLHPTKLELARVIAQDAEHIWGQGWPCAP